jgi:hypothetical protein
VIRLKPAVDQVHLAEQAAIVVALAALNWRCRVMAATSRRPAPS